MAKIWPVYEGKEPTHGGPWADLPVSEAIALFELRPDDFVSELELTPRFGDRTRNLTWVGFKRVVVEISGTEGRKVNWKPGFYATRITPEEGFRRLIQQSVTAVLGNENVVRVEYEPTTDSQGRDAIRVIVILAPDAPRRLANGASLDALVRLRERLSEMREERTPIVEFATEAELAEDGGR